VRPTRGSLRSSVTLNGLIRVSFARNATRVSAKTLKKPGKADVLPIFRPFCPIWSLFCLRNEFREPFSPGGSEHSVTLGDCVSWVTGDSPRSAPSHPIG